jgi:predicted alpha/beta-hydrolase family hydrolase
MAPSTHGSDRRTTYRTVTLIGDMALHCFLGHGASGTSASMTPYVDGLRARGVDATAIDLPKRKAEEAIPAFHKVVPRDAGTVVGGHSCGGRVASLAAAEPGAPYAALVLFSYPLHPPGSPDRTAARTAHWPAITCPVLLLSGESDPFARIELLRDNVPRLGGRAELVTYPRLGHGLLPVLDDVLDRVAAFLGSVDAGHGV